MFFGVLHKRNATHLWNMLYFQALFWILAATFTELPSVVCLFVRNAAECPFHSLRFITQALGLIDINGESTQSVLEVLFNRVLYPTDSWNMVSNTRRFPFLFIAQDILNRCSNTRIVCSSPHSIGPANLHARITLTYSHPSVRLSLYFSFGGHSPSFRVITSSRAYRDLFQYITG
jgi:hypothetical protein